MADCIYCVCTFTACLPARPACLPGTPPKHFDPNPNNLNGISTNILVNLFFFRFNFFGEKILYVCVCTKLFLFFFFFFEFILLQERDLSQSVIAVLRTHRGRGVSVKNTDFWPSSGFCEQKT